MDVESILIIHRVMLYEVTWDTELVNAEPLLLREIWG